jgi:adenylate cyclase
MVLTLPHVLSARRLRLGSGLVLFAYISGHLINHALGLWSLDAAEAMLRFAMAVWQSRIGTVLLYGAAALHFSLALRSIYIRHDWRFPLIEIIRLWAGFSLPLLLIGHVATTRLALALQDINPSYAGTVTSIIAGGSQQWQIALLAPGWLHGCLGLWISLRHYDLMQRLRNGLIAAVVLLPLLSAAGFLSMTREVEARGLVEAALGPQNPVSIERRAELITWRNNMTAIYLALIAGALLLGPVRKGVMVRGA